MGRVRSKIGWIHTYIGDVGDFSRLVCVCVGSG